MNTRIKHTQRADELATWHTASCTECGWASKPQLTPVVDALNHGDCPRCTRPPIDLHIDFARRA